MDENGYLKDHENNETFEKTLVDSEEPRDIPDGNEENSQVDNLTTTEQASSRENNVGKSNLFPV